MSAVNTDKCRKVQGNFSTTLSAGIDDDDVTIALSSASGLPTDTAVTLIIDRIDADGDEKASSLWELVTGVISGNNLTTALRGEGDTTAQAHDSGAVVECVVDEESWNDLVDAILAEHSQAGAHTTDIISEKTGAAGVTVDGVKLKDSQPYCDVINEKTATTGVTVDGILLKDDLDTSGIVGKTTAQTLTNKTLTSPVIQGTLDGWISANETWVYASATTITVPAGATSKYQKGDKIKLTQTTVKYFYIVGVADTVLTITGGTTYTLANAAISLNYYSHQENPLGFPSWFAFTPTWTGSGSLTYGGGDIQFAIVGRTVILKFAISSSTGGTADTTIIATCPVVGANHTVGATRGGGMRNSDASTFNGTWYLGTPNLINFDGPAFGNWTVGANRGIYGFVIYDL